MEAGENPGGFGACRSILKDTGFLPTKQNGSIPVPLHEVPVPGSGKSAKEDKAGSFLKGLLQVGNAESAGKGNAESSKPTPTRISYDPNALMEIGKNSASWKRPDFLDPDYDFVSKHDPHPRWDPERWHSSTKAAHMRNRKENHAAKENGTGKPDGMGAGKGTSGAEQNWRKKDKRASLVMDDEVEQKADEGEFRLGPQRRSYKEGCKPQNTKNDSGAGNAGRETSGNAGGGGTWREQRKNQRDNWRRGGPGDEDDKFREFRKDDSGDQRDGRGRGNRFQREYDSGRNSRHDKYSRHGGYGRNDNEDAEPEWMNDGPASHLDFMELGGFEDDHRGKQNHAQNRPDSPELVAFDPAAFGGSEEADGGLGDALEGGVGGGDDALEADIDGLLGSIGNDILDGDDDDAMLDQSQGANQSRFTKFFESSKPDSPKKPSPPISGNIQRLDPNVWPSADQMMPPANRHVRPGMHCSSASYFDENLSDTVYAPFQYVLPE